MHCCFGRWLLGGGGGGGVGCWGVVLVDKRGEGTKREKRELKGKKIKNKNKKQVDQQC